MISSLGKLVGRVWAFRIRFGARALKPKPKPNNVSKILNQALPAKSR